MRHIPFQKLGDLIKKVSAKKAKGGIYPILSMTMRDGLIDQADKFKKRVASLDTSNYLVVKKDQLVVGFPIDEGVLAIQSIYPSGIVSPAYKIWDVNQSIVDTKYLQYFLRSPISISYYKAKLRGSTARRRTLPDPIFLDYKVPLPPIDEQRRIAKILDTFERIERKLNKKFSLLNNLPNELFESFFQIKNNFLSNEYKKIKDISKIQGGLQVSHKRKNLPYSIPYLRVANVYRGYLNLLEIKKINCTEKELQRTELKKGDLLVVEGHGNSSEIGRVAVWHGGINPCIHQNHLIRIRPDFNKIKPEFLSFYLNSPIGRRSLLKAAKTTSGLNTISSSQVKDVQVPIYKIKDQENFVEKLSYIKKIQTKVEIQLDKFIELKKSLSQQLLGM